MKKQVRIVLLLLSVVALLLTAVVAFGQDGPIPAGTSNDEWEPVTRVDDFGIEQVWVPAGCFMMGTTEEDTAAGIEHCQTGGYSRNQCRYWYGDEGPQHEQCFEEGFWMDRYLVSNEAFQAFMDAGGYENPDYWTEAGWEWKQSSGSTQPHVWDNPDYNAPELPVSQVPWHAAVAYANWRGGRLPTEAQWEYAARGPEGLIYPWGNEWDGTLLNGCDVNCSRSDADQSVDDGYARLSPVDAFEAGQSWVGAYDMAGNVFEWTSTISHYNLKYPYVSDDVREDLNMDISRVVRGGTYGVPYHLARAASRSSFETLGSNGAPGFRIVTAVSE